MLAGDRAGEGFAASFRVGILTRIRLRCATDRPHASMGAHKRHAGLRLASGQSLSRKDS